MSAPGSPIRNGRFDEWEDVADPIGLFRPYNEGPQLNEQIQEAQLNQANAEVSAQYADAAQSGTLDSTTNQEISDLLRSGDPFTAGKILSQAKKGTGMYAVRKINENQKKLLSMRPGRAQLSERYSLISAI